MTAARLPTVDLATLAALRGVAGVGVIVGDSLTWVVWEAGDERVLRAVLPVAGVELFERRGGAWYRPGHHLPSFDVPPAGEPVPIARAVTPSPFSAEVVGGMAAASIMVPARLRLVRDGRPRPTSAASGPLSGLARWVDSAPSAEIEAVRGAISGDSALLLGDSLPAWPGFARSWGRSVLVPIGFEPRPSLPEAALREALGASTGEVLRIVPVGEEAGVGVDAEVEAIPPSAFRALTRAGVRLALEGLRP